VTRWRDQPVRTLISGAGQVLITVGAVLLLFVVYEVYVTDLLGGRKQDQAKAEMEQRWANAPALSSIPSTSTSTPTAPDVTSSSSDASDPAPAPRVRRYATVQGEGFAKIFIPAFGADYGFAIVEGTSTEDLYGSPGHYDDTQYPGELGNFAVAGHRVSKGSPFNGLGTLNSCDAIVIETQDDWFVYRVLPLEDEAASWAPTRPECAGVAPLSGNYAGVAGREITSPSDYPQVLPVPHVGAGGEEALQSATERLITLTTCHPQFSDRERMIIHGVLTKSYPKGPGFQPAELGES
jgi:sortase A